MSRRQSRVPTPVYGSITKTSVVAVSRSSLTLDFAESTLPAATVISSDPAVGPATFSSLSLYVHEKEKGGTPTGQRGKGSGDYTRNRVFRIQNQKEHSVFFVPVPTKPSSSPSD